MYQKSPYSPILDDKHFLDNMSVPHAKDMRTSYLKFKINPFDSFGRPILRNDKAIETSSCSISQDNLSPIRYNLIHSTW